MCGRNTEASIQAKHIKHTTIAGILLLSLALFSFFPPACIEILVPPLDDFIDLCRLFITAGAVVIYVKDGKLSKVVALVLLYYITLFLSSMANEGDIWEATSQMLQAVGLAVFTEICLRRNIKTFLKALVFLFAILCSINLITVLIYKDGLYTSRDFYFLGNYNTHVYYILPMLMAIFLNWETKMSFVARIAIVAVCSISFLICHSISSTVTMSVFMLLLIIREYSMKHRKHLFQKLENFYAIYVLGALAIVVGRIHSKFSFIIENVFHKNMTLTGRTPMWDRALKLLPDKLFVGFGLQTRDAMIKLIGKRHCHNLLLQTLFQTGTVGFMVFAGILLNVSRAIKKSPYKRYNSLFAITIFCFLVMYLTELSSIGTFLWVLTIAFHIRKIGSELEQRRGGG